MLLKIGCFSRNAINRVKNLEKYSFGLYNDNKKSIKKDNRTPWMPITDNLQPTTYCLYLIIIVIYCIYYVAIILDRPHNPMINSGAIITTALIKPEFSSSDKFDYVSSHFTTESFKPRFLLQELSNPEF